MYYDCIWILDIWYKIPSYAWPLVCHMLTPVGVNIWFQQEVEVCSDVLLCQAATSMMHCLFSVAAR